MRRAPWVLLGLTLQSGAVAIAAFAFGACSAPDPSVTIPPDYVRKLVDAAFGTGAPPPPPDGDSGDVSDAGPAANPACDGDIFCRTKYAMGPPSVDSTQNGGSHLPPPAADFRTQDCTKSDCHGGSATHWTFAGAVSQQSDGGWAGPGVEVWVSGIDQPLYTDSQGVFASKLPLPPGATGAVRASDAQYAKMSDHVPPAPKAITQSCSVCHIPGGRADASIQLP